MPKPGIPEGNEWNFWPLPRNGSPFWNLSSFIHVEVRQGEDMRKATCLNGYRLNGAKWPNVYVTDFNSKCDFGTYVAFHLGNEAGQRKIRPFSWKIDLFCCLVRLLLFFVSALILPFFLLVSILLYSLLLLFFFLCLFAMWILSVICHEAKTKPKFQGNCPN